MVTSLKFKRDFGRTPSITSSDPWEKRMAEGVAYLKRKVQFNDVDPDKLKGFDEKIKIFKGAGVLGKKIKFESGNMGNVLGRLFVLFIIKK